MFNVYETQNEIFRKLEYMQGRIDEFGLRDLMGYLNLTNGPKFTMEDYKFCKDAMIRYETYGALADLVDNQDKLRTYIGKEIQIVYYNTYYNKVETMTGILRIVDTEKENDRNKDFFIGMDEINKESVYKWNNFRVYSKSGGERDKELMKIYDKDGNLIIDNKMASDAFKIHNMFEDVLEKNRVSFYKADVYEKTEIKFDKTQIVDEEKFINAIKIMKSFEQQQYQAMINYSEKLKKKENVFYSKQEKAKLNKAKEINQNFGME